MASPRTNRFAWIAGNQALAWGLGILLLIVLIALFAPWISPFDPYVQDLDHRNVPPVW